MKALLLALALAPLVHSRVMDSYPSAPETAPSSYGEPQTQSDGYGAQPQCTYYEETKYREHCEEFDEKLCTTTHKESCTDVQDENCGGVISSKQTRKCFDVTELRCSLKEDVKMETIQMPVTVQKCRKVPEQVCDTIYDSSVSRKEKHQCITVENQKCTSTKKTIYDRTCRKTYVFDCETSTAYPQPSSGGGYGGGADSMSGSGGYGGGADSMSGGGGYSSQSAYGMPKPHCRKTPEEKCYKTPRQVTKQNCYDVPEKVCEKMYENIPSVKPRQSCHMEDKRACELVKRSQSKQVKKYVYSKQCRNVPRQVCENADQKTLVPSCVPTMRKKCDYTPVEKCETIPRKKCFNLAYKVRKQKCEAPAPTSSYGAPEPEVSSGGYGAQEETTSSYSADEDVQTGGGSSGGYGEPEPSDGY